MKGLCYNTQGVEYTTLVAKEMGFDAEKYDGETMIACVPTAATSPP